MKRRVVIGGALLAVIAASAMAYALAGTPARAATVPAVTYAMNMTATGKTQGSFGKPIVISALSHEIVTPRDPASGLPTGRRQHAPISVTMKWGATTPKFIRALVTNEIFSTVTINLLQNSVVVATITLNNAHAVQYDQTGQDLAIQLSYQRITWLWKNGGISATDDWSAPLT